MSFLLSIPKCVLAFLHREALFTFTRSGLAAGNLHVCVCVCVCVCMLIKIVKDHTSVSFNILAHLLLLFLTIFLKYAVFDL